VNYSPHQKRPIVCGSGGSPGIHAKVPGMIGDCDAGGINSQPELAALSEKLPALNAGGNARSTPGRGMCGLGRPQLGDQHARGRGVHANDEAGTCQQRRLWLLDWFGRLQDRLRTVRVCCGHWLRVCNSESVTTRLGIVGVFLDPPYPSHTAAGQQSRDASIYATDGERDELDRLRDEVLAYCRERGADRRMRIAVCGYDTDGYAALEEQGWDCVAWRAQGGYGNRGKKPKSKGNANAGRERIWFSPGCLPADRKLQRELFA
jgi:hypothetical protein